MSFSERLCCPVCQNTVATELIRMPMDSGTVLDYLVARYEGRINAQALAQMEYVLLTCHHCHSVWQQQILDDAGLNQLYDVWIDPDQSLARKQSLSTAGRLALSRLCAQISILFPNVQIKVLDFGMGWGDWLKMAIGFGFQADGLETSARRIAYARQNCLATVLPGEVVPETYHFINAEQVFEHLPDPVAALNDCLRWLKPGGVLRISVPDGSALAAKIARHQWEISDMVSRPLEHITIFTAHSIRQMATIAHFEITAPPLLLPMLAMNRAQVKAFVGIGVRDVAARFNIGLKTTVWLRKPRH